MKLVALALLALAACAGGPEALFVACEQVQLKNGSLTAVVRNTGSAPAKFEVGARYFTSAGLEIQGSSSWTPVDLAAGETRAITACCPFATASEGRLEIRPRR